MTPGFSTGTLTSSIIFRSHQGKKIPCTNFIPREFKVLNTKNIKSEMVKILEERKVNLLL